MARFWPGEVGGGKGRCVVVLEEGHRTISRLDPMHTIAKAILSIIAKESFDVKWKDHTRESSSDHNSKL